MGNTCFPHFFLFFFLNEGFGFGDAVIVELLKSKGLLPDSSLSSTQIVVYTMSEDLREKACATVTQLRDAGYSVDFVLGKKKPKWAFQHADRLKAPVVVMFAEEEFSKGQVVVKRMADGQQSVAEISNIVASIGEILSAPSQ
jgi:histidyl-tRNA synthetase